MSNSLHTVLVIGLVAIITFLLRAAPFLLFGGERGMPPMVDYLGRIVPPAIMAILVVYCFKSVSLMVAPYGLPEFFAMGVVVALHLWKRNFLFSVAGGTICYMVLIQGVFA